MKRLLIISPRFPPKNTPDLHRVRTSLPYFRQNGWEATVLALTPETCDGVEDMTLLESLPTDIVVHRVNAWREENCRRFGFGHLDYRCLVPLFREGTKLLRKQHYDLIYFSTTAFNTFLLAPLWKIRFGCKIVFDFQDPWYQAGGFAYDAKNVPGSWLKHRISQSLSRHAERFAVRAADHIISVSEGYVSSLSQRYSFLKRDQFTVIPFGAAPEDYEIVRRCQIQHDLFKKTGGYRHWVYVGRGGPDMIPTLKVLFQALARIKQSAPELVCRLRIHFVGTNYSPAARTSKVVEPVAEECGVVELVEERPERIPYFEAISAMADSDAILLIGSVSADYTASKLFNCILSGKPVLALFHAGSLVSQIITNFPTARLAAFERTPKEEGYPSVVEEEIYRLLKVPPDQGLLPQLLEPYSAAHLTQQQCAVFDRLLQL